MEVIRSAKNAKPFTVVPVSQDIMFDFNAYFLHFLRKQ